MQHTQYSKQLEFKRNIVYNAFKRIGGFEDINIPEVTASEKIFYYRNKLEFSFSNNRWLESKDLNNINADKNFALGFHIPKFIDKILDIDECLLQSDLSNRILNLTRDFFKNRNISVYTTKTHSGELRFLAIRNSAYTNQTLINLVTYDYNPNLAAEYAEYILNNTSGVTTIVNSVTKSKSQTSFAEEYHILYGNGYIKERIGGYIFRITPNGFFQTNSQQCYTLYKTAADIAEFSPKENVLDLYCGSGTIGIFFSSLVNSVYGVEQSKESIEAANLNAEINNVSNCRFEISDVMEFLHRLIYEESTKQKFPEKFSAIILDPPRSGIHPKAAEYLLEYGAEKIIYISCNPATQARDCALLKPKYKITKIQPVDMFPHTFHIENAVRLDRV
jgi:23S rRNA (uracil1939-C5)-methyltransferase